MDSRPVRTWKGNLGCVHTTASDTNNCRINKSRNHAVKFIIAGEYPPEPLQPPEKPLSLIAPFIQLPVIFPRALQVFFGGTAGLNRNSRAVSRVR
jgi:hypothetical protein